MVEAEIRSSSLSSGHEESIAKSEDVILFKVGHVQTNSNETEFSKRQFDSQQNIRDIILSVEIHEFCIMTCLRILLYIFQIYANNIAQLAIQPSREQRQNL